MTSIAAYFQSAVYLTTGALSLVMAIYFVRVHDGELRKILYTLFFAWAGHYIVLGALAFFAAILKREAVSANEMRIIASSSVCIQSWAMIRLYKYIRKSYGRPR